MRLIINILIFIVFLSCTHFQKNSTHQNISDASIAKGKLLAAQYCQSCHLLPDPSMLTADKWEEGVLPQMGPRLGIFAYGFNLYPSLVRDQNIGASFYPKKQVISFVDWQNIIDYYTSLSPDFALLSKADAPIVPTSKLFKPVPVNSHFFYKEPLTCSILINTLSRPKTLLIADIHNGGVVSTNTATQPVDSIQYKSPVADMVLQNDTLTTANIGMLNPNDAQTGSIQQVMYYNGKFLSQPIKLADSLRRPVHIDVVDLNGDGLKDILVCEFGNLKGALSWLQNKGGNRYERHVLRDQPGAIATVIKDFNKDGLPDLYVLFAQGDEQIVRFENKGNGRFDAKQLLRFPPVYGSSYFELADINKDGFDDIIHTCGDNADFSIELKPYHGVYIFENDGHDNFKQKFFFHINGCFKAIARDFDGDGDTDIAAISFFADYEKRPEESFVYLENKGAYHFVPYTVPGTQNGHWISMAAADIDGDGKTDIVLGNFSKSSFKQPSVNWKQQPAFLFLKNIMQ